MSKICADREQIEEALTAGNEITIDPNITELDLEALNFKDVDIQPLCRALAENTTLTWLNWKYCEIIGTQTEQVCNALSRHPSLRHLKLNGSARWSVKHVGELLEHNTALQVLNLSQNDVRDEGCEVLLRALQRNSTLKSLNLSSNNIAIDKAGPHALSEMLKLNTLTSLNLKLNHFHHYDTKSLKVLSEGLQHNTVLAKLNLNGNYIEATGMQWLSVGLKQHPALTHLNLTDASLTGQGTHWLGELLSGNHVLKTLVLDYAKVSEECCRVLAQSFKTLEELSVAQNKITNKGADWLSQGLKAHTQLKSLNLMKNNIGDGGCRLLCEALKTNSTLTQLDLRHNNITAAASGDVRDMLRVNRGLISLSVSSNDIDTRVLLETLAENHTLTELDTDDAFDEVAEMLDRNVPE